MRRISLVLVLGLSTMLLPDLVIGAEPELYLPGPGGNPAGIDRAILWLDNPDFAANTGSSEVIGAYGISSEIANDFILETGATIRRVTWWGTYWNGYEGIPTGSGFNIRFYYDAGCLPEVNPFSEYLLPGDVCGEMLAEGGDNFSQYIYEYCLDEPLYAGLYWFSVQMADHPFPPQWGRLGADQTQICDSAFRSEYFAYPEWVPAPDVFGDLYDASQMFEDQCGPGPCPPEGCDEFTATHAAFLFNIPGETEFRPIVVEGPTTVCRTEPDTLPTGECEIETEIIEMQLTGIYDPDLCDGLQLPVLIDLDPTSATLGTILSSVGDDGNPAFPDDSRFDVNVLIWIGDEGPYTHSIAELGSMLGNGDLWGDPPCVHPNDPYRPPSEDHAHIPCPPDPPPSGCCVLPCEIGDGCFVTYGLLCDMLGGTYLGDGSECDLDELCQDPTNVEVTTWGRIKTTYK